jgi:hypothetical protein
MCWEMWVIIHADNMGKYGKMDREVREVFYKGVLLSP